jgi:hypothetical protein
VALQTCPNCGGRVEEGHVGCPHCYGSLGRKPDESETQPSLAFLECGESWSRSIGPCAVLGGYGFPVRVGPPLVVTADPEGFHFGSDKSVTIPMSTILAIEIGGPGRTTAGGGFIGGGFGLEGAVTGMLVSTALNALTTSTSVLTVIAVLATEGEVWMANTHVEPAAMRIELAPAFVAVRRAAVTR